MSLLDAMKTASHARDIEGHYDHKTGEPRRAFGDLLAQYIAWEISRAFADGQGKGEADLTWDASVAIRRAADDLTSVADALQAAAESDPELSSVSQ